LIQNTSRHVSKPDFRKQRRCRPHCAQPPDVFHALSPALIAEITNAVQTAADDDSVRVVLLTATGEKAFCSGADLKEAAASGKSAGEILKDYYEPMITAIRDIPKPVICRMNGLAVGAGCSLALACDMVIAPDDTYLSLAFVQIGLMPDAGATFFLPRLIGLARSFELASTGRRVPAAEAREIGLISKTVTRETLDVKPKVLYPTTAMRLLGPLGL
jgi:2-(1,2-epoxy-1,2-dihydrophenyl)acetyl-CoA isomerase